MLKVWYRGFELLGYWITPMMVGAFDNPVEEFTIEVDIPEQYQREGEVIGWHGSKDEPMLGFQRMQELIDIYLDLYLDFIPVDEEGN